MDRVRKTGWRTLLWLIAPLVAASVSAPLAAEPSDPRLVQTDLGPVAGVVTRTYRAFQGIPYAAPPTGELRWAAPQPVKPWNVPLDASKPGSSCPQDAGTLAVPSLNEDCLYLNVFTPPPGKQPRPVMVWLHGGGFHSGDGAQYEAHRLASEGGVVVVTVNYRLGVFGFFGLPGLPGSGTFGLQDQQAALRWVKRNAAAFGGDPKNVTLFGESAGGMSTCAQMTSPGAVGLFSKAIIQSGACNVTWPKGVLHPLAPAYRLWAPRSEVEARGGQVANDLGCAGPAAALSCLRRLPVSELMKMHQRFVQPAFDTAILPRDPVLAVREGKFAAIPLMIGVTRDEHSAFVVMLAQQGPITPAKYQEFVANAFGDRSGSVSDRYPLAYYASPAEAWVAIGTDAGFACATHRLAEVSSSKAPTYVYEFADRDAPNPGYPTPRDFKFGATHASELAYLFDIASLRDSFSPAQKALSSQMIRSWAQFAKGGRPWPSFSVQAPYVRTLAPSGDAASIDFGADHQCDYWSR